MKTKLFQSTTGVNNTVDSSSLQFNLETGVTQLENATNVLIDKVGKLYTRNGNVLKQAGDYSLGSYPDADCFYVVEERVSDSSLIKVTPDVNGDLTLTPLRSTLTQSAKMSFCWMNQKTYYMNNNEYGVINEDASYTWPESIWPRETTKQKITTPIGELVEIFASRFFLSSGPELIWTEVGLFGIIDAVRNRRMFESDITMIAAVSGGVYISDSKSIYFFSGLDPNKWVMDNKVLNYAACKYGRLAGFIDPSFFGINNSNPAILFATSKGPVIGLSDGTVINLIDKQLDIDIDFTGIYEINGVITQCGNQSLITQSAVGEIGNKATSFSSEQFNNIIICNGFTYGINDVGIYLLEQDNLDNDSVFESSFTLSASDYGTHNSKRFRRIYLEVVIEDDIDLTISVAANEDTWKTKTISLTGAGTKKVDTTIPMKNALGHYQKVKISSFGQFKINSINGLFTVKSERY